MYVYLAKEGKFELLEKMKNQDEFRKLFDLLEVKEVKNKEQSILQYLVENGASYRVLDFANSLFAQTLGSRLDKLNVQGAKDEFENTQPDHFNFRLYNSFEPFIQFLQKGTPIHLNSKVIRIGHGEKLVKVDYLNKEGQIKELRASKVVLTVPLGILKSRDIQFDPVLPLQHERAINKLGFDGGGKVILWFKEAFWPTDFSICICSDSLFAQFWKERKYTGQTVECLMGFMMGNRSTELARLPENKLISMALKFYDSVFGNSENNYSPASSNFVDASIYFWEKNENIKGSYSYQYSSDSSQLRNISNLPINQQLYFSGEAFSLDACASVEGSLKSAQLTSQLILDQKKHSKL